MSELDGSTPGVHGRTEWWTSPRFAARLGGYLLFAGALLTAVGILLPHSVAIDTRDFWLLCAAQVLLGALMLVSSRLSPANGLRVATIAVFGAVLTISAAILISADSAEQGAVLNMFYVLPALYAGYFFRRRVTVAVVVTSALGYCLASTATDLGTSAVVIRVLITVAVVAGTAAVAHALRLHVDRLIQRLYRLARIDSLTMLMNRRGFDERLSIELDRTHRTGEPLALALGDLDQFKVLNDRFGHGAGDDALREVGEVLTSAVRSVDSVARVGGEEFAVLMPATGRHAAVAAVERLRKRVGEIRDPGGASLEITVGLVSTDSVNCADAAGLLLAADRALYKGKQTGRNRTIFYERTLSSRDAFSRRPEPVVPPTVASQS